MQTEHKAQYSAEEYEALQKQLKETKKEVRRLNIKLMNLERQYRDKCVAYEAISCSTIWRMTAPLRRLKDRLNGSKADASRRKLKQEPVTQIALKEYLVPGSRQKVRILTEQHTLLIARLLAEALGNRKIETEIITDKPMSFDNGLYILICAQTFPVLPKYYIAFQMEQWVASRWFNETYFQILNRAQAIFDYSGENISYLREHISNADKIYYLPIDCLPELCEPEGEYAYDILFYGDTGSERRQLMLSELQEQFSVKTICGLLGDELYKELRKAKLVINIHYYEDALLETTRLYEVLSLGRSVIISERSTDETEDRRLEGAVDFVEVGDTEEMEDRIRYWLTHEEERQEKVADNIRKLQQRPNVFAAGLDRFLSEQQVFMPEAAAAAD